ncbi:AMP-binding protein [Streptomyces sp. LBUM 1476]|nr:AMP-binding protein [Streptomyces sp. LBUM 1476]
MVPTKVPRWAAWDADEDAVGEVVVRLSPGPLAALRRLSGAESVASVESVETQALLLAPLVKVLAEITAERHVTVGHLAPGTTDRGAPHALRTEIPDGSWRDLVTAVTTSLARRSAAAQPFDIVLDLSRTGDAESPAGPVTLAPDTALHVALVTGDHPALHLHHRTRVIDTAYADRLGGYFRTALDHLTAAPDAGHGALDLPSEQEREHHLHKLAGPAVPLPDTMFPALFEERARAHPDAVAVSRGDVSWDYRTLDAAANRVAAALLRHGLRPEDVVAVVMDRTLDWAATLLGVLKAGGTYLPVRPDFPAQRVATQLRRSDCRLVVAEESARDLVRDTGTALEGQDTTTLFAEDLLRGDDDPGSPHTRIEPGQSAYVYFTSGSTGAPKGAQCEHAGMINHLYAKIDSVGLCAGDVVTQTASQCFDISLWQLVAPGWSAPPHASWTPTPSSTPSGSSTNSPTTGCPSPSSSPRTSRSCSASWNAPRATSASSARSRSRARPSNSTRCAAGSACSPASSSSTPTAPPRSATTPCTRCSPRRPCATSSPSAAPCATSARTYSTRAAGSPPGLTRRDRLRRSVRRTRIHQRPGTHRGGVRPGPLRTGRPHVPHRRLRPLAARRHHRIPRPARPAGQGPGLPYRDRRDREQTPHRPRRPRLRRRRRPRRGHGRRQEPRGLLRRLRPGRGTRAARPPVRAAPRLHGPRAHPPPGRHAAQRERQDRQADAHGTRRDPRPRPGITHRPRHPTERWLATEWAEALGVPLERIGRDDHFFHLGGTSLTAVRFVVELDRAISLKQLIGTPVLADLAALLDADADSRPADHALLQPLADPVPEPLSTLVCFPYAGGNAVNFRLLAERLAEHGIAVLGVELPAHDVTVTPNSPRTSRRSPAASATNCSSARPDP